MLTGEIKQKCIACLQELTKEHQERRALATAEKVQDYWSVRKLKYDFPDPPKSKPRRLSRAYFKFLLVEVKTGKKEKKRGGAKNQKSA